VDAFDASLAHTVAKPEVLLVLRQPRSVELLNQLEAEARKSQSLFAQQHRKRGFVPSIKHQQHVRFGIARPAPPPSVRAALAGITEDSLAVFGTGYPFAKLRGELADQLFGEAQSFQAGRGERDVQAAMDVIRLEVRIPNIERAQPLLGCLLIGDAEQQKTRMAQLAISVEEDSLDVLYLQWHSLSQRIRSRSRAMKPDSGNWFPTPKRRSHVLVSSALM